MINFSWQKHATTKKGTNITFRYPHSEDAEEMMHYINQFVEEDEFLLINEKQTLEQEQKWLESVIENMCEARQVLIFVEQEGKIVASAHVIANQYKSSHVGAFGISVAKEYRGQGIGELLMQEIMKQASEFLGIKVIELTCFANNEKALKLYKKLGFVEFGRLPKGMIYKGKEFKDKVYMWKEI